MRFERREDQRRRGGAFGERGMRCESCGTLWYSAVASTVVDWGRCIHCNGALHLDRRHGDRRHANASAAA